MKAKLYEKQGLRTLFLFSHPQIQNFHQLVDNNLEPSIYNFKTLKAFISYAIEHTLKEYPIQLKFNTGLNRLGLWHNDIDLITKTINQSDHVKVKAVLSHLAASEDHEEREFTLSQLKQFAEIKDHIVERLDYTPMFHTLNTSRGY